MVQGADGNNQSVRQYFYASYDDVHDDNVETSTIDKQDAKANSVFDANKTTATGAVAEGLRGVEQNKAKLLDASSLQNKAAQIYDTLLSKFTGVTYQTDTQAKADDADAQFDRDASKILADAKSQITEAINAAAAEIKETSVTNERNTNGSINGLASYTKDDNGSVTGMNVISNKSGNSFRYEKGADDKFYEVDSEGNHIKDKAGNEKAYTLNEDGALVRDNSNAKPAASAKPGKPSKPVKTSKPAKTSQPAASANNGSSQPTVTRTTYNEKTGETRVYFSNGNMTTIYNNGDENYAIREDTFDQNGKNTSGVARNKKGQVTQMYKYTYNKDRSYYTDSTHHNGVYNNRITRFAGNADGIIEDKAQAAKTAGLEPSKKYKGYYTDGKYFYRWNQEDNNFVMQANTKLAKKFNK